MYCIFCTGWQFFKARTLGLSRKTEGHPKTAG